LYLLAVALPATFLLGSDLERQAGPRASAIFNTPREIHTAPANGGVRSIRIITWNIDRGTRVDAVASDLEKDPAGLYLLQEVDWGTMRTHNADIAAELAHMLHMNAAYGIEFEELGQERNGVTAYIGQATLTRLPIQQVRVLRFREQSGWWGPRSWIPSALPLMQRRVGGRIALITELRFANRPLVVYNAHLESRSLGKLQSEQMDEILVDAKRYSPDTSIIIGGDLNTKYFPSRFLKKMEEAGFRSALGRRIERTHKIAMALDWIFVRGPLEVEGGQVLRVSNGSDHYPVYARLIAR
jgi:endonuclease/exonuclease/phosphatase family metal-dependent hydrolase